MNDIIARLEAAEAGSRELDAWIFCAVVHPDKKPEWNFFYTNREEWGVFVTNAPMPGIVFHDAPHYTTSLDAALTLVPDGWTVACINQNDDKSWATELREGFLTSYDRVVFGPTNHKSPTPALALCIAALKARKP